MCPHGESFTAVLVNPWVPLVIKQDSEQSRNPIYSSPHGRLKGTRDESENSFGVIPFVCPHTLRFNIHLHWHYLCGAGEHQLCPPICCWNRPKHLDPPKKLWEKQQQAKRQGLQLVCAWLSVWRLCAGLWYVYVHVCVCVCIYLVLLLYYELGHSCQGHLIVRASHSICSRR